MVSFPDASVAVEIPVRFAETDAMGVVHHAAYIVWFELGRVAWLDAAGVPYLEVAASGHHFAVTGLEAEYRGALRFGETVCLETAIAALRSRRIDFAYQLYDGDGGLVARGRSQHICVDLEGRSAQIPGPLLARMKRGRERLAGAVS